MATRKDIALAKLIAAATPKALLELILNLADFYWETGEIVTKATSALWNEYIERYHYLGHKALPGAQLRYFITVGDQIVALAGFGAAAWQTAPRDQFIGWTHDQRKANLHLIVNNARFLILPWIQSQNLASKVLSLITHRLPDDWHNTYNIRPVLLETFIQKKIVSQGPVIKPQIGNLLEKRKGVVN